MKDRYSIKEFDAEIYNDLLKILNENKNILILDKRNGFDVVENGQKIFGITIIDLYSALHIGDCVFDLPAQNMSKIYNICCDKYMTQNKQADVRTIKTNMVGDAQKKSLAHLKKFLPKTR